MQLLLHCTKHCKNFDMWDHLPHKLGPAHCYTHIFLDMDTLVGIVRQPKNKTVYTFSSFNTWHMYLCTNRLTTVRISDPIYSTNWVVDIWALKCAITWTLLLTFLWNLSALTFYISPQLKFYFNTIWTWSKVLPFHNLVHIEKAW